MHKVLLVVSDLKEIQVQRDLKEHKEWLEIQGHNDLKGIQVLLDLSEMMVHKVLQEHREHNELSDHKVLMLLLL